MTSLFMTLLAMIEPMCHQGPATGQGVGFGDGALEAAPGLHYRPAVVEVNGAAGACCAAGKGIGDGMYRGWVGGFDRGWMHGGMEQGDGTGGCVGGCSGGCVGGCTGEWDRRSGTREEMWERHKDSGEFAGMAGAVKMRRGCRPGVFRDSGRRGAVQEQRRQQGSAQKQRPGAKHGR